MSITTSYSAANETNGLFNGFEYHTAVDYANEMTLREVADAKGKITRVRVLAEGIRCDVSYIHATLPNGSIVPVSLNDLNESGLVYKLKGDFIAWGKSVGVFAKGVDLLNDSVWSVLR